MTDLCKNSPPTEVMMAPLCAPPFSYQIFKKWWGTGLTEAQFLEGDCWDRGG